MSCDHPQIGWKQPASTLVYFFFIIIITRIILLHAFQHDTLVTIVAMLKDAAREVTFDLSARAEYLDPERLERTVYISPLAANVTPEMIKVGLVTIILQGQLQPHNIMYCNVATLSLFLENVLLQEMWSHQVSQSGEASKEKVCLCQGQLCLGGICP